MNALNHKMRSITFPRMEAPRNHRNFFKWFPGTRSRSRKQKTNFELKIVGEADIAGGGPWRTCRWACVTVEGHCFFHFFPPDSWQMARGYCDPPKFPFPLSPDPPRPPQETPLIDFKTRGRGAWNDNCPTKQLNYISSFLDDFFSPPPRSFFLAQQGEQKFPVSQVN